MPLDGSHLDAASLTVRLAANADGDAIQMLRAACGYRDDPCLNWSDIAPHWLVACRGGDIVGALQVCLGKPVGRLEMLAVHPGLNGRDRALTVQALAYQGMAVLRLHGAQMADFLIPFELASYKRVLKKRGAVTIDSGHILRKKL